MYAWVRCLNGFNKELVYAIPPDMVDSIKPGCVVQVPLQNRFEIGLVSTTALQLPEPVRFTIKPVKRLLPFPADPCYTTFIQRISSHYWVPVPTLYQRLKTFLEREAECNDPVLPTSDDTQPVSPTLSSEQATAAHYLEQALETPTYDPILLHGVTGSGKTEVYKRAIIRAHQIGKTTILLLPEVTLCVQFWHRLRAALPSNIPLFDFHSATKAADKKRVWHALCTGQPVVVLGVHLPILLPLPNLGLIIIDEEHEQGFVEKKHPRINSKEAALLRAQVHQIPIILGSATPSVQTLSLADTKKWRQFAITQRFSGNFPRIKQVVMTDPAHKQRRGWSWLSKELVQEIERTLARKEQVMLYLNRRGYSFFVQCKECGYVAMCHACSVSMTLHQLNGITTLQCHYCNHITNMPTQCPDCKSDTRNFLKKGIGTQYLVDLCMQAFPQARIARADLDQTRQRKGWQTTIEAFAKGQIDILVGTQTITKGYDFPGVTLVGIIWADLSLHFPEYNAAETTLQQLIQVAGRAGRHTQESTVIVQTMRPHPIFAYVDELKYLEFCKEELAARKPLRYPPFGRIAHVELRNTDEQSIEKDTIQLAQKAHELVQLLPGLTILGPSLPVVHKIAHTQLRQLTLKAPTHATIHQALQQIARLELESSIFFVV